MTEGQKGGIVTFNRNVIGEDSQDEPVSYNESGIFTIIKSGNYLVTWNIVLKSGIGNNGVLFSLLADHTLSEEITSHKEYPSSNLMKTGQLSGSAIIQVKEGYTCELGLYNTGNNSAVLSNTTEINANITIHPYIAELDSLPNGLIGLQLVLDSNSTEDLELTYGRPVIFNSIVHRSASFFEYNDTTGEITFTNGGSYFVIWSVNLDGSEDTTDISFSLMSNNGTLATTHRTLLLQNSFDGFSFITLDAHDTLRLVNTTSNASVTFSNIAHRASLILIGHR